MSGPKVIGGSVQVMALVRALCGVNDEAVVLVGDDGCLYFAHRNTPHLLEGRLDLSDLDDPKAERIQGAAGVLGSGLLEAWLDFDMALDRA